MMIRDTSLEAYRTLANLNEKQKAVYNVIKSRQPIPDIQIAEILEWPINRVTPRRNELEKAKLIYSKKKVVTSTGRSAHAWVTTEPETFKVDAVGQFTFL